MDVTITQYPWWFDWLLDSGFTAENVYDLISGLQAAVILLITVLILSFCIKVLARFIKVSWKDDDKDAR